MLSKLDISWFFCLLYFIFLNWNTRYVSLQLDLHYFPSIHPSIIRGLGEAPRPPSNQSFLSGFLGRYRGDPKPAMKQNLFSLAWVLPPAACARNTSPGWHWMDITAMLLDSDWSVQLDPFDLKEQQLWKSRAPHLIVSKAEHRQMLLTSSVLAFRFLPSTRGHRCVFRSAITCVC